VRLVSLTVGLSLVVGVVGGVEMGAASVLSVWSWSALALAVTALASYVAARRRPASRPARPAVRRSSGARRAAPVAAVLAALVVLGVAIGVARTPLPVPDDRGYTSLSITPAPGGADAVIVRVASAEADTKDFVLALAIPGRAVERQTFSIAPGEAEEFAASVDPGVAGRVTAALAEVETPEIVYRRVRLGLPLPGPAPMTSRPEAG
jgi:hypothetical protein